jgi:hypothetical protein
MPSSATQQFSGIFISYRRDDSSGYAGRLSDRLVEHFGRTRIFMDIDAIEPGEDFVTVIENAVGSCEILIAIIGRSWLSTSGTGTGRLDNPNDFVRLEISTALRRNIRVIPVLVQHASMPKEKDLPEDMVNFTRRNAVELSDLRWQTDVDQLIAVMERLLAKRAETERLAEATKESEEEGKRRAEGRRVQHEQEAKEVERRKREAAAETTKLLEEEERLAAEARFRESSLPARDKQLDEHSMAITDGTTSPPDKNRRLVLIAAATTLIVLAVSVAVIWRTQWRSTSSGNTNQAVPAQPSFVTQPVSAKSTQKQAVTVPSDGTGANATGLGGEEVFKPGEPTLWKRDDSGTILQIVRNANSLRAVMDSPSPTAEAAGRRKGDLAFDGTYEGGTIRGTAYLLFSETDVRRCPAFGGDQPFALSLTLSVDGNSLSGSREDYKLSDDCEKINLPRRRLTYSRLSR